MNDTSPDRAFLESLLECLMVPTIALCDDGTIAYINSAGEAWLFESGILAEAGALGRRLDPEHLPGDAIRSEIYIAGRPGVLAHRPASSIQRDPASGLPNATVAFGTLTKALQAADRLGTRLCVIHLLTDMSRRLGMARGRTEATRLDRLMGQRLKAAARRGEFICTPGSGEYVILSLACDQVEDAWNAAARWVDAVSRPLEMEGREMSCNVSAGFAVSPDHGRSASVLLDHAHCAAQLAVAEGRNEIKAFSESIAASIAEDLELENDLVHAIDHDELYLVFQPKLYADSRRTELIGAEALLRWQHPRRGLVSPARFIPLAERTGLMPRLGGWILEHAFEQVAAWKRLGLRTVAVAINVSGHQLVQADFRLRIEQLLRQHGLTHRDISLEITESALLADIDGSILLLNSLRGMGVQIAIDDFGTGYSSLGYLRQFPADLLKIDRSFVRDVESNKRASGIFKAIAVMAETLSMDLIVEGVESELQHRALVELGCHHFQGFLFGRPESASTFAERWLATEQAE